MVIWGLSVLTSKAALMRLQRIVALTVLLLISVLPLGTAHAATNVLFILDSSGSMWEQVNGVAKIVIAKRALNDTLSALPSDTQLGLMTYGHRRKGDCNDIEMLSPIGTAKSAAIAAKVRALTPKGETPIAAALMQAADALKKYPTDHNHIVLITDGAEECRGDPCAAAKELAASGLDVHINVVGFNLGKKQRDAVECVAREGHGKYYDAQSATALASAMQSVSAEIKQPSPPLPSPEPGVVNLLAVSQGGQLLLAPDDSWKAVTTGGDSDVGRVQANQEAVYAFKDDRPATFKSFSVLIPGATDLNLGDVELLVGNDSPTGTFQSLGKFKVQNAKMMKTPYQEFTFPETTAKYLKIKLLSNTGYPGGKIDLHQIRLTGKLAAANAELPSTPPQETGVVNLLDPTQGGQLLIAPNDNWKASISGNEADVGQVQAGGADGSPCCEAIYAFKDERPATFTSFSILIPSAGETNPADLELLVGSDSPIGAFHSIGKFKVQNTKMIQNPYQEFTFPATTAKYLKIKFLSNTGYPGGKIDLHQIRLMGKLAQ